MRDDSALAEELDASRGDDAESIHVPAHTEATEDAVAQAFAEVYAGCFLFDHTRGRWFMWRDGQWLMDRRSKVFHTARRFARAVAATKKEPPASMGKIAFASAVERAARSDPKMAVSHEIWDADAFLLGTPGGLVDLRTGILTDARPDQYVSRYTTVAPALVGTPTPLWTAFLSQATKDDAEFQQFLQRFCGYILTGDVTEEVLAFLYGSGGNGKGVFLGTVAAILGDYAVSVPLELFTANSRINAEHYRAQMAGARLVTASETETQAAWAEAQIKEMTGNEAPLSARHPYGQPFTYRPQFKICLVGNHAPKLKGRSPAMERRLRVLPFTNAPPTPDSDLKEKLRAEYPAILRWMLDGCAVWQRDRLGSAPAIAAATSAYFEQQDAFRRWLDERCVLDKTLKLKPGLLLANFNAWAQANGEDTMSNNAFAEMIDRTPHLEREKVNGVRLVKGIGLNAPSRGRDDRDD